MENAVQITGLDFSYAGSRSVLRIDNFCLKRGERVFLQGDSGSGKTTLLGLITGLLTPSQGSVSVLGSKLEGLSTSARDALRGEKMGYIFQIFNLIPYLTVRQNIVLPLELHASRRLRLGAKNLDAEVGRLANALSLQHCLDKSVTQLSVGQQQRVAAARALIGRPELIIADEPTSALDHNQRGIFIELLMQECRQSETSLLFVSHDPTLAVCFDRSVKMNQLNGVMA